MKLFKLQTLSRNLFGTQQDTMTLPETAAGPRQEAWLRRGLGMELLVFALIVAVGASSRLWLQELPNFKPVAALALFAGFYFRRFWLAVVAVVVIMLVSDSWLGAYDWRLTISVYGSLGLASLIGWFVQRWARKAGDADRPAGGRRWLQFAAASVVMSTTFFVLTNGAVWCIGGWYSGDLLGLAQCYVAAIPFYRATLIGDLMFTGAIMGVYQLAVVMVRAADSTQPSASLVESV